MRTLPFVVSQIRSKILASMCTLIVHDSRSTILLCLLAASISIANFGFSKNKFLRCLERLNRFTSNHLRLTWHGDETDVTISIMIFIILLNTTAFFEGFKFFTSNRSAQITSHFKSLVLTFRTKLLTRLLPSATSSSANSSLVIWISWLSHATAKCL